MRTISSHTWQQAAERESRQRLRRFLLIAVALLGLLGGIVGEQLGLWSLRAVVDRAVEMVRQRVALVSGIAAAPEAGGGRDQGRQVAPLARRTLPTATSGHERANAGTAVPPAPQEPARGSPLLLPCCRVVQLPAIAPVQPVGGAKELAIKKVVVVRSGDTLSRHSRPRIWGIYQSCRRPGQRGQSRLTQYSLPRDRAASDFARAPRVRAGIVWQTSKLYPHRSIPH